MSEAATRAREQVREEKQLEDRLSRALGITAAAMGLLLVVGGGLSASYAGPAGGIGLVFGVLATCWGLAGSGAPL